MISVVVESWNVAGSARELDRLLAKLAPQLAGQPSELVVTYSGLSAAVQRALETTAECAIRWVELPADASYYEHKNRGFDASSGEIVAFIDGDCRPCDGWLAELTAPIVERGARVVAGATSYAGPLASIANAIDFPYFDGRTARQTTIEQAPATVRNFFANNVAFARDVFAARRYPTIAPMFHGQCQVLGLQLLEAGITVRFAAAARVTHAWPGGVTEWLSVRLLRGADTALLLPYIARTYAPRAAPAVERLGPLPALAVFCARAVRSSATAVSRGPRLRGLGFVALATVVDAIGAAAAPATYRFASR